MCLEVKCWLYVSTCISFVLQTPTSLASNPISLTHVEAYLQALEAFNLSEPSCRSLTHAIKTLEDSLDFHRQDEFSSPLFVFPALRKDVFPDLRYRNAFKANSNILIGRVDVIIHRVDGTMFAFVFYNRDTAFRSLKEAVEIFQRIEIRNEAGVTYRGIKRPITHRVFIGFSILKNSSKNFTLSSSCLFDSYDVEKAVNVTV